jgi:hypothetical protein
MEEVKYNKCTYHTTYPGFTCRCQADSSANTDEYGHAEFQPGMEEVEAPLLATSTAASGAEKTNVSTPPKIVEPVEGEDAETGYSVLQKGLFFMVILGCVGVYMRMGNKKTRRYQDKDMA